MEVEAYASIKDKDVTTFVWKNIVKYIRPHFEWSIRDYVVTGPYLSLGSRQTPPFGLCTNTSLLSLLHRLSGEAEKGIK